MAKRKIYVYQSVYGDGENFEHDVHVEAFGSKKRAIATLKEDATAVKEEFKELGYEQSELEIKEFDDLIEISANHFADWWEGKIVECEIQ